MILLEISLQNNDYIFYIAFEGFSSFTVSVKTPLRSYHH